MTSIGLPVPDGFTVTTEACRAYLAGGGAWPDGLSDEVSRHLAALEERCGGRRLGDPDDPLLVSVRSGSPVSMPGMMDTILNLGLNPRSVEGLARASGNERFAADSYRRFVQMYSNVVLGVPSDLFEDALTRAKSSRGVARRRRPRRVRAARARRGVPLDQPRADRARLPGGPPGAARRRDHRRVRVVEHAPRADVSPPRGHLRRPRHGRQHHADGVRQPRATTRPPGVVFTRNPSTGERVLFGEFLRERAGRGRRRRHPHAAADRARCRARLARGVPRAGGGRWRRSRPHYRDLQDVEFTIERGELYVLQTRAGKRTAQAAVRVARELVAEGVIERDEAVQRINAGQLDQLMHPAIDPGADYEVLADGPQRLAGCRRRPGGIRRRHGRGARAGGRARHPRPVGDDAGRHPRRDPGPGRPHGPRRHDVARRGRRPRDGQAVRVRRRGACRSTRQSGGLPSTGRPCPRATRSRSTAAAAS